MPKTTAPPCAPVRRTPARFAKLALGQREDRLVRDRHPLAVQAHAPAAPALVDADKFRLLKEVDRTGRRLRAVVHKLAELAHGKLPARIAPMARSIDSAHTRYALFIQHGC